MKVECTDQTIYKSYDSLRNFTYFNNLFSRGVTQVTSEESEDEILYQIPTLKLDCSSKVFDFVIQPDKRIFYRDEKLVLCTVEWASDTIEQTYDIPISEAFYYTSLYNMYNIKWHSENGCSGEMQMPLLKYLDSETHGLNIFKFLNESYDFGLDTLVPYCYKVAIEGKLSERVIQDLIEYIPTFVNGMYGNYPFICWDEKDHESYSNSWIIVLLNFIDFVDEESLNGLTYKVINPFKGPISREVQKLIDIVKNRVENPRYSFLLEGLQAYLSSIYPALNYQHLVNLRIIH